MRNRKSLEPWRSARALNEPLPGPGGWTWRDAQGNEYHTDRLGDGLWCRTGAGAWRQVEETETFSVPRTRAAALRYLAKRGYIVA